MVEDSRVFNQQHSDFGVRVVVVAMPRPGRGVDQVARSPLDRLLADLRIARPLDPAECRSAGNPGVSRGLLPTSETCEMDEEQQRQLSLN
jgi:hypothetical protein